MKLKLFLLVNIPLCLSAQNYTAYHTGSSIDLDVNPLGGVCLMGGATEDDNAMTWFLEQANGGDVLVLRASGSDGYNDYLYSGLGVTINSVETIVCHNSAASAESYIHSKIQTAEAIWFAGGDQWNYISYWRNTAIDSLINLAIQERNIVIGGTSAGMAILGSVYFTAENGTVTSSTALQNPYATNVTIDSSSFLKVPFMQSVITDTHYDNPDRRGRHFTFMTRMYSDYLISSPYGIACEEYVAVCVGTDGIAHVYGGYPTYDEQAYFIRLNCDYSNEECPPQQCVAGSNLTWNCNDQTFTAYKVNGTPSGTNTFNLNTWDAGTGGTWLYWFADSGSFYETAANVLPNCLLSNPEGVENHLKISPNPAAQTSIISLVSDSPIEYIELVDLTGKIIHLSKPGTNQFDLTLTHVSAGLYTVNYQIATGWFSSKIMVY